MERVKTPTAVAEKPAYSTDGTPGYFRHGDPVQSIPPTVPGQDWFNQVQEELVNVILEAGIELDPEDDSQLAQAVQALIAAALAAQSTSRYETMWLGAGAMIPSKTNGAAASTPEGTNYKLVSDVLDFASSADQSAQAVFQLPRNWDRGPIKAQVHWRPGAAGATAGQYVGWMLSGGAVGDGDVVDRALGAGVTVADQVLAGLDTVEHVSAASAEITLGGNPALGDRLHLQITRDADYSGGGTAMPVVARLLGLEIQYRVTGTAEAWS